MSQSTPTQPLHHTLLLVGAALLALLAQRTFWSTFAFSWEALAAAVGAVLLLYIASDAGVPADAVNVATPRWSPHWWRWALAALAVALIAIVLLALPAGRPAYPTVTWTLIPWVGALVCYLMAVGIRAPAALRGLALPATRTMLVLAGVTGVAALLRLSALAAAPVLLGGDEAEQGVEAMRVLSGDLNNPFTTGWLGVPTMSFYFNALWIGAFGQTTWALRLPWAIVGTVGVPLLFVLLRRLWGDGPALLAAGVLAVSPFHIHFSRLGSNQIADPLFVTLALIALFRGYTDGNRLSWAWCGVMIGIAQYFYAGARFTGVVVFAVLTLLLIQDGWRGWRAHWRGILALAGGLALSAAPMVQYAVRFPEDYNARVNLVGILSESYLTRETAARGTDVAGLLAEQAKRAFLAFNAYPDKSPWYNSPLPLLGFVDGALFLLGLGVATLRFWNWRLAPIVGWWWGAVLLGGMLTENPPNSQRLMTASVPACCCVAYGLWLLVGGRREPQNRRTGCPLGQPQNRSAVQSLTADHRRRTTDDRPPMTDHRPPTTDHQPKLALSAAEGTTGHGLRHDRIPHTAYRIPRTSYLRSIAMWGCVVLIGFFGVREYFGPYTASLRYSGPNTMVTNALGVYGRDELGAGGKLIFLGAPRVFAFAGVPRYLAPGVELVDIDKPLNTPPETSLVRENQPTAFIALPERVNELAYVQQTFPNGTTQDINAPDGSGLLMRVYRVR